MESELVSHFLRFGDLESVAFQPGRSYVFLNFVEEEDAVDAIEELQGFPLAGNPLRIEFAKAVSLVSISLFCCTGSIFTCLCLYQVVIFLCLSKAAIDYQQKI